MTHDLTRFSEQLATSNDKDNPAVHQKQTNHLNDNSVKVFDTICRDHLDLWNVVVA